MMRTPLPSKTLLLCMMRLVSGVLLLYFSVFDLPLSPPPPFPFFPWILHHAAFALQSLGTGLLPRALAVDVEAHVPLLVQVEQLLKELGYVVVGLS